MKNHPTVLPTFGKIASLSWYSPSWITTVLVGIMVEIAKLHWGKCRGLIYFYIISVFIFTRSNDDHWFPSFNCFFSHIFLIVCIINISDDNYEHNYSSYPIVDILEKTSLYIIRSRRLYLLNYLTCSLFFFFFEGSLNF